MPVLFKWLQRIINGEIEKQNTVQSVNFDRLLVLSLIIITRSNQVMNKICQYFLILSIILIKRGSSVFLYGCNLQVIFPQMQISFPLTQLNVLLMQI